MHNKYWLITYSQREKGGNEISANEVINIHPATHLANLVDVHPECNNKLLFAIEISIRQYQALGGKL